MEPKAAVVKVLLFYFIYLFQSSAADTLQYFYTAVTSGTGLPMLSAAVQLNGEHFLYYDSIRKLVLKTEWIQKLFAESDYLVLQTEEIEGDLGDLKHVLSELMNFHNHIQGFHTVQRIYGCVVGEKGIVSGINRYGYDGDDSLSLDLQTLNWTAADTEANSVLSGLKWKNDKFLLNLKHHLENKCKDFLQLCVKYTKNLERKVRPEGFVFQQQLSSSPDRVCLASGFFPREVVMSWQRDGENIQDVEVRETLPNQDGSFQKRIILKVSSKNLGKHTYTCVIQHSAMNEDLILPVSDHWIQRGSHSLQYLYTAVTSGTNFPEFTAVVLVDGEQILYYDSSIDRLIHKVQWMERIKFDSSDYWKDKAEDIQADKEDLKNLLSSVTESFDHSQLHTMQRMYGCELSDDGTIGGFERFAFDGEDFIKLDIKTLTWTTHNSKANRTKTIWNMRGDAQTRKDYLENICINDLKKYVSYGRETLERRVRPKVELFQQQRSSFPELVCHATGFFPKAVVMTWQKDGEEVKEDVEVRETLPNQDGSFQKRIILRVSPEDLQKNKYTCEIQHSSLKEDLRVKEIQVIKVDGVPIGMIVGGVVGLLVLVLVVGGIMLWKKKNSGFSSVSTTGSGCEGGDSDSNGLELKERNGLH